MESFVKDRQGSKMPFGCCDRKGSVLIKGTKLQVSGIIFRLKQSVFANWRNATVTMSYRAARMTTPGKVGEKRVPSAELTLLTR